MSYSPFGRLIYDSTPDLEFPFGFRGAIYDALGEILFFVGARRVYDPALGSWMTPDFSVLPEVGEDPRLMNFYAFGDPFRPKTDGAEDNVNGLRDIHAQGKGFSLSLVLPKSRFVYTFIRRGLWGPLAN